MPHAQAPPHSGAAGDVLLGRDALYGVRIVSTDFLLVLKKIFSFIY